MKPRLLHSSSTHRKKKLRKKGLLFFKLTLDLFRREGFGGRFRDDRRARAMDARPVNLAPRRDLFLLSVLSPVGSDVGSSSDCDRRLGMTRQMGGGFRII